MMHSMGHSDSVWDGVEYLSSLVCFYKWELPASRLKPWEKAGDGIESGSHPRDGCDRSLPLSYWILPV